MGMRIKLDEDLSPMVGEPLREAGHVILTVAQQGWSGLKDTDLWSRVVEEGVYFITADKGFGDIRAFPPGTHPGILLLRPGRESILDYRELVARIVRNHPMDSLVGAITVATPSGVRTRRPPRTDAT